MSDVDDSRAGINGRNRVDRRTEHKLGTRTRRRCRKGFDFCAQRRCEIVRDARDVGVADSDDFSRWLIAWVWHNQKSTDPLWALQNAAIRMGGQLTEAQAAAILDEAKETRRHMSADRLGGWLGP